ncbi:MAG TPA: hypothetical protein VLA13_03410 [Massilibacterium sp.]|nr:hypothetical protein [Massilibacterium sp.]
MNRPKTFEVASNRLADCTRLLKTIQRDIFANIEEHVTYHVDDMDGEVSATVNLRDIEEYTVEAAETQSELVNLVCLLIIAKQDEINEYLDELADEYEQGLREEHDERKYQASHMPGRV